MVDSRIFFRRRLHWLSAMLFLCCPLANANDEVLVEDPGVVADGYPVALVAEIASSTPTHVHSGTVTVSTRQRLRLNVPGTPQIPGVFIGLDYRGNGGGHCDWLQFVWREIHITTPSGRRALSGRVGTTGGEYDLTTDPNSPNYNPDSGRSSDPTYESSGASNDSTGLAIFDLPGISKPAVDAARQPGVSRVDSIAHFDSYLICSGVVLVHVAWTVTYTWSAAGGWQGPEFKASRPDRSGARPNQRQMAALNRQYPGQGILR